MDGLDRCYLSALRILKVRFNSAAELKRKLLARGFSRDEIAPAIERLTQENWIDDLRFAGAYTRTRLLKRVGPLRIRRELIRAGVDDETIELALAGNRDADAERARALALAGRRLPILRRRYEERMARNKLTAYLLKQGYDAALVREIVKEITVVHH
ncbi:MAG TPA: regulatory protein RecX [Thermoanaerobaculia bacterium]|jgi:regulatory protein|nr:regulatory protein RecX [Thermoanaerobaculia bacterium]